MSDKKRQSLCCAFVCLGREYLQKMSEERGTGLKVTRVLLEAASKRVRVKIEVLPKLMAEQ